MVLFLECWC